MKIAIAVLLLALAGLARGQETAPVASRSLVLGVTGLG
jgi:hypothetical protein